jgi:uncharacterized repeat protein (TIGR01451 family)
LAYSPGAKLVVFNSILPKVSSITSILVNCGDVTLNKISVVDDKLGPIILDVNVLAPGEKATGLTSYVVNEEDVPGPLRESVEVEYNPCIDIGKEADVESAGIGDTITYTYTVTNCGDVTLTDVYVEDDMLGSIYLEDTYPISRREHFWNRFLCS